MVQIFLERKVCDMSHCKFCYGRLTLTPQSSYWFYCAKCRIPGSFSEILQAEFSKYYVDIQDNHIVYEQIMIVNGDERYIIGNVHDGNYGYGRVGTEVCIPPDIVNSPLNWGPKIPLVDWDTSNVESILRKSRMIMSFC